MPPGQSAPVLLVGTQVSNTTFGTAARGTLYITDNANNALDTVNGVFKPGTVYVAAPAESGVARFGTLDLTTGAINPVITNLANPEGLLLIAGP